MVDVHYKHPAGKRKPIWSDMQQVPELPYMTPGFGMWWER